jgi:hypothetical protein
MESPFGFYDTGLFMLRKEIFEYANIAVDAMLTQAAAQNQARNVDAKRCSGRKDLDTSHTSAPDVASRFTASRINEGGSGDPR